MNIKELEALLETTRQKIANQGRIVDARLMDKERELEQAVIDAHLDAEQATSHCKKCRAVIKNGGDWGYCTCCYEETRAEEEQADE